MQTTYLTNKKG